MSERYIIEFRLTGRGPWELWGRADSWEEAMELVETLAWLHGAHKVRLRPVTRRPGGELRAEPEVQQ